MVFSFPSGWWHGPAQPSIELSRVPGEDLSYEASYQDRGIVVAKGSLEPHLEKTLKDEILRRIEDASSQRGKYPSSHLGEVKVLRFDNNCEMIVQIRVYFEWEDMPGGRILSSAGHEPNLASRASSEALRSRNTKPAESSRPKVRNFGPAIRSWPFKDNPSRIDHARSQRYPHPPPIYVYLTPPPSRRSTPPPLKAM